ncbi:hypothetical protein NDU88_000657 [Pleurodeles waltl]|uniref:Uncharacterized protein n=1 Tax=Pleurodeles waltl TaxID=8319 RepID=A0AAV7L8S7_PLEWA|nr:hypothetical protein NDU88_000657 [Pleurodeles waltl]
MKSQAGPGVTHGAGHLTAGAEVRWRRAEEGGGSRGGAGGLCPEDLGCPGAALPGPRSPAGGRELDPGAGERWPGRERPGDRGRRRTAAPGARAGPGRGLQPLESDPEPPEVDRLSLITTLGTEGCLRPGRGTGGQSRDPRREHHSPPGEHRSRAHNSTCPGTGWRRERCSTNRPWARVARPALCHWGQGNRALSVLCSAQTRE